MYQKLQNIIQSLRLKKNKNKWPITPLLLTTLSPRCPFSGKDNTGCKANVTILGEFIALFAKSHHSLDQGIIEGATYLVGPRGKWHNQICGNALDQKVSEKFFHFKFQESPIVRQAVLSEGWPAGDTLGGV